MSRYILIAGILASFLMLLITPSVREDEDYQVMYEIAASVDKAYRLVREEKSARGLDLHDSTGLLGPDFTGITTTLGSLESKTTSLNPNFTSVIYKYLKSMQLKDGAKVAVNLSGSFPALNIQTLLVLEAMGYEPVIISSIGASTHGANDPEFTYPEMEIMLYNRGILNHRSVLVSPGGDDDMGTNMDPELLGAVFNRLEALDTNTYLEADYDKNLDHRLEVYDGCKALINIGGNYMSFTGNDIGYENDYGIIRASAAYNYDERGLVGAFLTEQKDVLHLLNIKGIAVDNHLPIDPAMPVEIGSSGRFYNEGYSRGWFGITLLLISIFSVRTVYDQRKTDRQHLKELVRKELMD